MLNPLYTKEITKLIEKRDNMEMNNIEESELKDTEKEIYDKFVKNIEKRTEQMINILCEMYKYDDDDSKSKDEKNTNK